MVNRYRARYRLPGSRYTKSSPVILSAGALLEDTQIPRLVVQLKFRSISPKLIVGLTIAVRCFDAIGNEVENTNFAYKNLRVLHGRSFGAYTAIALPVSNACRFTAVVTSAVFSDGEGWVRKEDTATLSDAAPIVTAAHQKPAPATQVVEDEDPSMVFSAEVRAEPLIPESVPVSIKERRRLRIKGRRLAFVGACAAFLIAAAILIPKMLDAAQPTPLEPNLQSDNNDPASNAATPSPNPSSDPQSAHIAKFNISTPSDGERVTIDLTFGDKEYAQLTEDMLRQYFPEMTGFSDAWSVYEDDEIDDLLAGSYSMARLIGSRGFFAGGNSYKHIYADRPCAILVFSNTTTLCGYYVGNAEDVGEGSIKLEFTRCNYEFSDLYERLSREYSAAEHPPHIDIDWRSPESSGVSYFIRGYNLGGGASVEDENTQFFHLWNLASSPDFKRDVQDISRWTDRLPQSNERLETSYYYLFDADYRLLGYTRISSEDTGTYRLPVPTLPAPTNLRWEILQYSANVPMLTWDWVPPSGERVEDYHCTISYSEDGEMWRGYIGMYSVTGQISMDSPILSGFIDKSGKYRVRLAVWKGETQNTVEEISPWVESSIPLTVTVKDSAFVPSSFGVDLSGDDDDNITIASSVLVPGNVYYFKVQSLGEGYNSWSSRMANAADAASGSLVFSNLTWATENLLRNVPDAKGVNIGFWEVSDSAVTDGAPFMTVSAGPKPIYVPFED